MEPIQNFNDVLKHLENNQIVVFFSPLLTYCVIKNDKVEIISSVSRLSISINDFNDLFDHEVFYLYTRKNDDEIDLDKDNDYYGLRYQ